jgi:hypothetical protein
MDRIGAISADADRLAVIEAYWRDLRGARRLPARTEVDPSRIDAALPHSFILERLAPGVARMRVAGQMVSAYLGTEARGLPLCALFDGDSKERVMGWLEQVFACPAIVELPLSSSWGFGRPRLSGRMLLLPLHDGTGAVTRAMGAISVEGAPGRTPRSFALAEWAPVRIENVTGLPAMTGTAQRPALRLVVSNP